MKTFTKITTVIFFLILCVSCEKELEEKKTKPKKTIDLKPVNQLVDFLYPSTGSSIHLGDSLPLRFSVTEQSSELDSLCIQTDTGVLTFTQNIDELKQVFIDFRTLGPQFITLSFYKGGETQVVSKEIVLFSDEKPQVISYEVVQKFPHDTEAYTQGLEFVGGDFYESTGLNGLSDFRKVDLATGKVLNQKKVSGEYFAEGLTFFNDKFYQLTWKKGVCFVYDKQMNLLQTRELPFETQGWGLTHNDTCLIMSNGTENICFLDAETLQPLKTLPVYTDTRKIRELNELELINGLIYANVYQSNEIVIIDPFVGKVKAILNLEGILERGDVVPGYTDVLNGIAYNSSSKKLYVTGKRWPFLYQIKTTFLNK